MKTCEATDSFPMYSREVDRHEPLSAANEQKDLFARMKKADKGSYTRIRNEIFARSLRLVICEAKRIRHRYPDLPFEDMVQAGNLGLLRAIEKFDLNKGKKFSTYATWWIRSYIHENCMNTTGPMRVPIDVWKASGKIRRTINGGNSLTDEELAERTGLEVGIVETVREVRSRHMIQLDEIRPGYDGHESTWHSFVADGRRSSPEAIAIASLDCERFLKPVEPGTRSAIVRHFVMGEELSDIAPEFGITRQGLSIRIHKVMRAGGFEAYS